MSEKGLPFVPGSWTERNEEVSGKGRRVVEVLVTEERVSSVWVDIPTSASDEDGDVEDWYLKELVDEYVDALESDGRFSDVADNTALAAEYLDRYEVRERSARILPEST